MAYLIPGGLAGQGGALDGRISLEGQTNEVGVTVLSNENFEVMIENGIASVLNTDSRRIGKLRHIVRQSVTMGMPAPQESVVLFDGENTDNLLDASTGCRGGASHK